VAKLCVPHHSNSLIEYRVGRKKWTTTQSVNIMYVNCRMLMPETGSGDDKELIFSTILFMLNILFDISHDVVHKHVYIWQI